MDITREEVLHIARLAKIRLDDDQIQSYQQDLSKILDYVEKLQQVDTTNVEPTTHAVNLETVLREDEVEQRLSHQEIVQNAPALHDEQFMVPKVVED